VYTNILLTFTAISRRNRKVPPLGITALQPQSHVHLGTPYISNLVSHSARLTYRPFDYTHKNARSFSTNRSTVAQNRIVIAFVQLDTFQITTAISFPTGQNIFTFTECLGWRWEPPNLLTNCLAVCFPEVKRPGYEVKTRLYLVPRSCMRGAMFSVPHTPSWLGICNVGEKFNGSLSWRTETSSRCLTEEILGRDSSRTN
jgi:hypothetical protein